MRPRSTSSCRQRSSWPTIPDTEHLTGVISAGSTYALTEDFGEIHWPGDTNKEGVELYRPISRRVREVLLALRPRVVDPEAPIFPSPRNPGQPFGRRQFTKLLMKAYEKAGLKPEPGGAWHPFRRKWVTERKGYPLADIAAAGGWKR